MLNAFFYNLVPAYFDEIREQKQINARYRRKRILEATLLFVYLHDPPVELPGLAGCRHVPGHTAVRSQSLKHTRKLDKLWVSGALQEKQTNSLKHQ